MQQARSFENISGISTGIQNARLDTLTPQSDILNYQVSQYWCDENESIYFTLWLEKRQTSQDKVEYDVAFRYVDSDE